MQFPTISPILLLGISTVYAQPAYDVSIPAPVCAKFNTIKMKGDAEFVDSDNSAGFNPTTGDMTIGEVYTAVSGVPDQLPIFGGMDVQFKSVCFVTKDQNPPEISSPTCLYEFQMTFCRHWKKVKFPEQLSSKSLPRDQVIPEQEIINALNQLDKGVSSNRALRHTPSNRELNKKGPRPNRPRPDRPRPRPNPPSPSAPVPAPVPAPTPIDDGDEVIEAVQITKEFSDLNPDLVDIVCPNLFCWIPFYRECRSGGFTAHGSGPDNLEISGGTYDFFGAFGQIETPTDFDLGDVGQNGDLTGSSIEMNIELCYYKRGEFF